MIIKKLFLKNFRNFSFFELNFNKKIVFFAGDNGAGKTNLLEAIYYFSNLSSFRTSHNEELIKFGKDFAEIQIYFVKEREENIKIYFEKGNKTIFLNNRPLKKMREIIGKFNTVLFEKTDILIISGEKEKRRDFLDREIPLFSPSYYFYIKQYQNILYQRNQLLKNSKDIEKDFLNISCWDEQLSNTGIEIIKKRKEFIKKLNFNFSKFYKLLSGNKDASIFYIPSIDPENREEYLNALSKNLGEDIKFNSTQIGPHRDDLKFQVENRDLRKFSSSGEQRCATLALKLGLLKLIKEEKGNTPVLLLDDVFSELDSAHKEFLKNLIINEIDSQVFITSSSGEDLKFFKDAEVFQIQNNLSN